MAAWIVALEMWGVSHNQNILPHTDTFCHYAARGMKVFL
jgi:hypothetical protein